MSPVDFKKWPCRPVEFKGQGPLVKHVYDHYQCGVSFFQFPAIHFQRPAFSLTKLEFP